MSYNTKFGEANCEYKKFRPTYPQELFKLIFDNIEAKSYKAAIDLGAGTGISTAVLCNYFDTVYAVEPDKKMIQTSDFPKNATTHNCAAGEFNTEAETVDLVTAGNAFYWMNGDVVIKNIYRWLRKDGVFAAYRYDFPSIIPEIQTIIDAELKKRWNQYRHKRLIDTSYSLRTIQDSQLFSDIAVKRVPNIINLSAEELVGFFRSTSYGSAYIRTLEKPI